MGTVGMLKHILCGSSSHPPLVERLATVPWRLMWEQQCTQINLLAEQLSVMMEDLPVRFSLSAKPRAVLLDLVMPIHKSCRCLCIEDYRRKALSHP